MISGNEAEGWLAFTKRRFLPEGVNHGLSLGCGHGWTEREAIRLGLCRTFDALDISDEAIEVARRAAARQGLAARAYRQADLNAVELERTPTTSSSPHRCFTTSRRSNTCSTRSPARFAEAASSS